MEDPKLILQKYWAYDDFRNIQEPVIQSILEGHDTLALLPTGGGKSLCYQIPAMCKPGVCLVISPLIALMKDQVMRLKSLGIDAETIHSGIPFKDTERILENTVRGSVKLLYISPERLNSYRFRNRIEFLKINLIAVDEAHCISQWGYDFRPAYLQIADIRELSSAPILALTATATPKVKEDIISKLNLRDCKIYSMSFRRENLQFVAEKQDHKLDRLIHILNRTKGTAIVYTRNRKHTSEISHVLQQHKISADFYHAGLKSNERDLKQEAWIQNKFRVMVSTNAFGMGIDKSDVSAVIHTDLPQSLEEYYQEAGRAGRDGTTAFSIILYNQRDILRLDAQFESMFPDKQKIQTVYKALALYYNIAVGGMLEESMDFDLQEFAAKYQFATVQLMYTLKILEQAGWITLSEAVYVPSKVFIKIDRAMILSYEDQMPNIFSVYQTLLRSYEGIHSSLVLIFEHQIAKNCKIELEELLKILQFMDRENLIEYKPSKDKSQIYFPVERLRSTELVIDEKWLTERKSVYKQKIEGMLAYLDERQCRQVNILKYFGEEKAEICGKCDLCLQRKNAAPDFLVMKKWRQEILILLEKNGKISLRECYQRFPSNKKLWVDHLLKEMIGEEEIVRDMEWLVKRIDKN
ncbi:MAG: RecQ family ATP-dependent DNA helicase [Bacteroidota bacterium]|nr:RecQ family ATP-dependent DNA helicase [Bacteroidota bacterium]